MSGSSGPSRRRSTSSRIYRTTNRGPGATYHRHSRESGNPDRHHAGHQRWLDSRFCGNDGASLKALLFVDVAEIALPIAMVALQQQLGGRRAAGDDLAQGIEKARFVVAGRVQPVAGVEGGLRKDRKSTRLNSSHANISYAVFCLK